MKIKMRGPLKWNGNPIHLRQTQKIIRAFLLTFVEARRVYFQEKQKNFRMNNVRLCVTV